MYNWGKRSLRRIKGVNKDLILCATISLEESEHDMTIPWMGGVRKAVEQKAIYLAGNSKLDGYKKKSYHQTGNALDIIPVIGKYKNIEAMDYFSLLMFKNWKILKNKKQVSGSLQWGGNWKNFVDKPHYQIVI